VSLSALARLLGIKPDHAEDALHSERAARAVLAQVCRQQAIDIKRALVSMVRERDRLQQTTRPRVQLSTLYPPQENQDKDSE
jgi:hypothetical protein